MPKKVSDLSNSMNSNKQPDKKLTGREMDKYRKRLKRADIALGKRISSGEFKGNKLEAAKEYQSKLKRAISESYKTKEGYKQDRDFYSDLSETVSFRARDEIYVQVDKRNEDTVHALDQSREQLDFKTQMRKNKQFERELAQSRIKGGVSSISALETTVFYRATQSIWENEKVTNRNAAIMKYFGTSSLEDAFNKVLNNEEVRKEMQRIKELSSKADDTKTVMGGKDKDEEDWKYDNSIIGTLSSRFFK